MPRQALRNARPLASAFASTLVFAAGFAACSNETGGGPLSGSTTPDGGPVADGSAEAGPRPVPTGDYPLPPNAPGAVTECARPEVTPAASGTCEVTTTGTSGRLFRGTVLAPDEVLHRGEVLVDKDGKIACVGCDCTAAKGYAEASVVSCAEGVISPGLINPHDHITYANNPPLPHLLADGKTPERYEHRHDWRKGARGHTIIKYASGASKALVSFAELRFAMSGVTSIAGAGGEKGLVRNIDDGDLALLEGLPVLVANSDTFPLGDVAGTVLADGCDYGGGATTASEVRNYEGYLPHIGEGINDFAHNEIVCTSTDDRATKKNNLVQRQSAVIHAVAIGAKDADAYRKAQTSVVWSPRSNIDLYGNTAPITMLDALGVQIALGTDWVPSGSMNMLRELHCADSLNASYFAKHFSDADLFRMVTLNAAFAVGAQNVIGALRPGYVADIAIFDGHVNKDYRAVLDAGVEDVVLVLRGGKPLYGDDAIVASPVIDGAACEALDTAGRPKRACVAKDIGGTTTLATLQEAAKLIYPLFFPKATTPENEPSCVPYRDTYKEGITATDSDGDGIANDADNCPTAFNPIRPLDGTAQADADGDGAGDACDRCPLDATNGCVKPIANDFDGDGVLDGKDNCPEVANADQGDGDNDGRGDACDPCEAPNGGATPCPVTLRSLRDPNDVAHVQQGTIVAIAGACVTARSPSPYNGSSRGLYVQAHDAANPTPQPLSGIFLFTGAATATDLGNADVGASVAATGVYRENFGVSQIVVFPGNFIATAGTLPFGPLPVTAAQIKTGGANAEDYESMLVQIDNAGGPLAVTNENPDAPSYFYELTVTGGLRIADDIFTRFGKPAAPPVPVPLPYLNGTTFTRITGIESYSFSNAKLLPRNAADIVSP